MDDAFTPWTGNQGIPMIAQGLLDDDITPDWNKEPEILQANPAIIAVQAIRLLVVAAAALGVIQTYRQVVGDASADVDDLVRDIQDWLRGERFRRGLARQQRPDNRPKEYGHPIRDGESHEDAVLRALDELEKEPDFPDPGDADTGPYEPIGPTGGNKQDSFLYWLERTYDRRSVAQYMRRR